MKVLICGGGIAGLATAYWLARGGHEVTVAERHPVLRATGAQIDLRGQGIEATARMGLLDEVRRIRVDEPGVAFVNARGERRGVVMANTSGKGRQTMTSEYEIMRGDLVRVLHAAVEDDVALRFGVGVEDLEQDESSVVARFSDRTTDEFDLLIGADGQGSRVRSAVLPPDAPDPRWPVGIHMAYWFIPRTASDSNLRETYCAPGGRVIMRRSHNPTETQVYFALWEQSAEASAVHRLPVEQQKQFWADRYRGAGWQTERFLQGMADTDFFYSQEVLQIRTNTWSRGRIALVGDAAHCSSPYSGMGTSGGLVGAYVLAGEVNRAPGDLTRALTSYRTALRPFVDRIQAEVNPKLLRVGFPRTRFGINALLTVGAVGSALRLPELAARFAKEDRGGGWPLPDY
jgi:2-polyprenyl-6-methoxyphenol hydroxylase-like FAD-dependent oxidoreductase